MTLQKKDVPLAEITAAVEQIRNEALYTWRRKAQKIALLGWRDSSVPPGVSARFTPAGKDFYHFSKRKRKYWKAKGRSPDYVRTGAFRDSLLKRVPHSANTGKTSGEVRTTLSIDGGALNALSTKRGYTKLHVDRVTKVTHQPDYTRTIHGKTIAVRGSDQRRTYLEIQYDMASRSYRDEFQITDADLRDIEARDAIAFREIVRNAVFTKSGQLKSSALDKFRGTEIDDGEDD